VGGVGYELLTPIGALGRLGGDAATVTFFVHTHVREDALILYGFATDADRTAFRALISVSNVGPKTAIAVLSALPGPELARTIANKDVPKLTSISGVGKKTAERLVLELRDKLSLEGALGTATAAASAPKGSELLIGALVNMGYRQAEAERAVTALGDRMGKAPLADLVREALVVLAR
jgi:holliday junction DNA helicase RuvA